MPRNFDCLSFSLKHPVSLCIAFLSLAYDNGDLRVPFSPTERNLKRSVIAASLATAAILSITVFAASRYTPPPPKFLQLSEAERWWFLEGSFRTLSHLIYLEDETKGNCVADFYLKDKATKETKRQLIEKTIAENPKIGETTVIIGLLTQACGPLVPPPNR